MVIERESHRNEKGKVKRAILSNLEEGIERERIKDFERKLEIFKIYKYI